MTHRTSGDTELWLGQESETRAAFGAGELWIGRHAADDEILILDPATTDPSASVLSLYSLTQHRMRSFPRATVSQQIHAVEDEVVRLQAREAYEQRETRRAALEELRSVEQAARKGRQREAVIAAHRRYMESLGLPYQGERETGTGRQRRRTRCHMCGISLDDFAGAVCMTCDGVLCSCGACACRAVEGTV